MTDIKKTAKENDKKAKKLRLNKETITDLYVKKAAGGNIKGGAAGDDYTCTYRASGC